MPQSSVSVLNQFSHFTALSTPFGVYCIQTGEQITVFEEYWEFWSVNDQCGGYWDFWWAIAHRRTHGNFVEIWLKEKMWRGFLPYGSSITIQGNDWIYWRKPLNRLKTRSLSLWNYLNGRGPKPASLR